MSGLVKGKEYKVEDSNVENLGGADHKDAVKAAGLTDPAWKHWESYMNGKCFDKPSGSVKVAGDARHHVEVWRIEKFKVRFWPKEKHGAFHTGDAYIILHTFQRKEGGEWLKIEHDLYFWLGRESTQDEQGTAAYKTVEIDTILDDVPIQHRECQDYESNEFQVLWANTLDCGGIRYLDGGVDSGFRHVEKSVRDPKLFHVKGTKKGIRYSQMPVKMESLNSGDVYILDYDPAVIVWVGAKASRLERTKACNCARKIVEERFGKVKVEIIEEAEVKDPDCHDDLNKFYKELGGDVNTPIKTAEEGGKDEDVLDKENDRPLQLYRISDASGSLKMTKECEGTINKSSLDTNDVFVLDCGREMFVWVGAGATDQERNQAIPLTDKYKKENNRPAQISVTRVLEGKETKAFLAKLS